MLSWVIFEEGNCLNADVADAGGVRGHEERGTRFFGDFDVGAYGHLGFAFGELGEGGSHCIDRVGDGESEGDVFCGKDCY